MTKLRIVLIYLGVAIAIAAWIKVAPGLMNPPAHSSALTAQPSPRPVPDFKLTDQRGAAVTRESLTGQVWLANFIFSSCPGPCLDLTKRMRSLQDALASRGDVSFVSFSIDPQHDTPAQLADYAQKQAAGPRWYFLTGDRATTARVANDGFLFPLSPDVTNFAHSERIAVVDRQGVVRGWFDSHSEQLVDEVVRLVQTL